MKKELHIKHGKLGYVVAFKDGRNWLAFTSVDLPHDIALLRAEKLIRDNPAEFLETICNCSTDLLE